jgi:hypothetical protein
MIFKISSTCFGQIQINPTPENAGQINFLDLTITRKTTNLEIDIFWKPNTTINYLSNHPLEQKLAAYRYYIDRMYNLPPTKKTNKKNGPLF